MEPVVIVALIGFAGILVSSVVGPLVINYFNNRREEKKTQQEKEDQKKKEDQENRKDAEDKAWQQEIRSTVNPIGHKVDKVDVAVDTMAARISAIEDMLEKNEDATILSLRVDMKSIRDRIIDRELTPDSGERITWAELYKTYYKHGGNHFKEAVDEWGKEMGFTPDELKTFRQEVKEELEKEALEKEAKAKAEAEAANK